VLAGSFHHPWSDRPALSPEQMVTDSVLMGLQVVGALAERVVFVVFARRERSPRQRLLP